MKIKEIAKYVGIAILAVIVLAIVIRIIGWSVAPLVQKTGVGSSISLGMPAYDMAYNGYAKVESSPEMLKISTRNVAPSATGDTAEEFEVTEYNATVETRDLTDTCNKIISLKSRTDVIFENSTTYTKSCTHLFKVKKASVPEILTFVKELKPRDLSENTQTIKRQVDDYTSELEILTKKMTTVESTLESAVRAYDDVTRLATNTRDVESLSKIIESKLAIIERLTQEKINVSSQIERLTRAKADQLDRIDYTYFSVTILENKFIDWQNIGDSWKSAIRTFVGDVNSIVQDITINLLALVLFILQYILYFFILLVVVKYTWLAAKYIWKK